MLSTSVQPGACLRVRTWAVTDWQRIHRGQPLGALAITAQPGHARGRTRGNRPSVQPVALAEEKRWATARDALGLAGLAFHKLRDLRASRSMRLSKDLRAATKRTRSEQPRRAKLSANRCLHTRWHLQADG